MLRAIIAACACASACGSASSPTVATPPIGNRGADTHRPLDPAVADAIAAVKQATWQRLWDVRTLLFAHRAAALEPLVALIERDDRIPLTDIGDLIYPGVKEIHDHGYVVPYDLDCVGDRAG